MSHLEHKHHVSAHWHDALVGMNQLLHSEKFWAFVLMILLLLLIVAMIVWLPKVSLLPSNDISLYYPYT